MKKITLILSALSLSFAVSAQTSLTNAVDFTVTDINGNTHTLFDYLDDGKYVCIDFFAYWCGPCTQLASDFSENYNMYGCNTGDVVFLAIEYEGTEQQVIDFETQYAGSNPAPASSGTVGGGGLVHADYGIQAYPTFILIAPDGTIVENDIWPMDVDILDTTLSNYGLTYMACTNDVEEAVVEFGVYPVPANDILNVKLNETGASIELINLIGATVISTVATDLNTQLDISALDAGSYLVRVTQKGDVRTKAIQIVK